MVLVSEREDKSEFEQDDDDDGYRLAEGSHEEKCMPFLEFWQWNFQAKF
jgi:hypothetical protein